MEELLKNYRIGQLSLAKVLRAEESTPLSQAIQSMKEEKSGYVTTFSGEVLNGIFTERDLIHRVMNEDINWNDPIKNFVTKSPLTLREDDQVYKAVTLMKESKIRHVPIFDSNNENLKGVLSVRNIIKLFAEHFPAEVMNLPPELHKHPSTPEGG